MSAGFKVAAEAIKAARSIGLGGEVDLRLSRMAKRAAPYTGSNGNRRFGEFVLTVRDGIIMGICRL